MNHTASTHPACLVTLVLMLAACGKRAPAAPAAAQAPTPAVATTARAGADDAYDVAKMDFKTPPAVLSNERHSGLFASGDALSLDAVLKPLLPAPVKEIRLDTTHKINEIAPGVKFSAWTFGDQVPGPAVRARVGDRIKFTMTNRCAIG